MSNAASITRLPLLGFNRPDAPLLYKDNRIVTRAEFSNAVRSVSQALPTARYAINLCRDRYCFMLVFAAACLRGQTNLLPASQASGALDDVRGAYPDSYVADDQFVLSLETLPSSASSDLLIPADHVAAICFTSGSSGTARAHSNTWSTLVGSAERSAAGIFTARGLSLAATVPPQHMFGLETSILQPLFNDCAIHTGKPFFPADVYAALASMPAPRALITAPAHLRACLAALPNVPDVRFILSATAPLATELAAQVEQQWNTHVLEIYGSTETGAIATRRTTDGDAWRLLSGGALIESDNVAMFQPRGSTRHIPLHDSLRTIDASRFTLMGRSGDLIKVAGKRASLSELNARLAAIPGVQDGIIFQPQEDHRVAALVVSVSVDARDILAALGAHFDEVFLPRPIKFVTALPRDDVGKLPKERLLAALDNG